MLHLYKSNRLEALADALAEVTRAPLRSALAPEKVIVQSLGMRRWLSLALADRLGVTMNTEFPFSAAFAHETFATLLPDLPPDPAFVRDVLPWRVLGALPQLLPRPEFAGLRRYCAGENAALKQFQLAEKIATVFDRYLAYRPELLREWSKPHRQTSKRTQPDLPGIFDVDNETNLASFSADERWQAELWRALIRGRAATAPMLAEVLGQRLREGSLDGAALPERISIFGISSLPPLYLDLLGVVAKFRPVHFFLLEPTPDYWADLVTPRELDRAVRRRTLPVIPVEEDLPFTGNPLLGSLCKTGRDFEWLLLDKFEPESERELFIEPPGATLLSQLQADIFQLREPGPDRRAIAAGDRSVQVHCCHGPLRELEVLHDQLLDLFQTTPGLAPRDILVAMPDVETYAPFIDAVFGAPENEAVRIPYTIADRATRAESSVADALLRVLDFVGSRFPASEVLALLGTPAVRARFGLAEGDLPLLHAWVARSGIRWGIDAEHRASLGLPAFAENSWRWGLDRLLLGYALPGDDGTLFEGILPDREIEGATAETLGQFVEFVEQLFAHCAALAAPRSLAAWEDTLRAVVEAFFDASDEFADEIRRLNAALETLGEHARLAGFSGLVDLAAMRAHLAKALADSDSGPGFLAGHVTFCALKPMRSIPFRVLCLLGLNDTAFPRRGQKLTFDLVAQRPRRGDRSLRDDDRYLFLEGILSARETLYLSYAGLSAKDGAESPPSVLVSELLDYLARHFALPPDFVTKHRLQAFSAAYFTGESPRLFSYSRENARAAEQGGSARASAPLFAARALSAPGAEWRTVSLAQLTEFFGHPAKFFLRQRLRLRLPAEESPLDDAEPASLDSLSRYQFRDDLTRRSLARGALASNAAVARASGRLPPGYAGNSAYGTLEEEVAEFLEKIRPSLATRVLEPFPIDLPVGEFRLIGILNDVRAASLLRYRAGDVRPKDRLAAWIAHLALQCVAPKTHSRVTIFHGLNEAFHFAPLDKARDILAELLSFYARGLQMPLPFFPKSSLEFARRKLDGTAERAKAKASEIWFGGDFKRGECDDAFLRLAFRGVENPLDADFEAASLGIWQPLLNAMKDL